MGVRANRVVLVVGLAACGSDDPQPTNTSPKAYAAPAAQISGGIDPSDDTASAPLTMRFPSIRGQLTRTGVVKTVRNRIGELRFCWKAARKRNPNAKGLVTLDFRVEPDGSLERVEILGSTVGDEALDRCLLRAVETVKFPETRNKESARITYPITLGEAQKPAHLPGAPTTEPPGRSDPATD